MQLGHDERAGERVLAQVQARHRAVLRLRPVSDRDKVRLGDNRDGEARSSHHIARNVLRCGQHLRLNVNGILFLDYYLFYNYFLTFI